MPRPQWNAEYVHESEASWMTWVEDMADLRSWRHYHTLRSKGSDPGFPDLVLVRGDRLIFAELKTDRGRLSADQVVWLDDLDGVSTGRRRRRTGYPVPEVYVWRPADRELIRAVLW